MAKWIWVSQEGKLEEAEMTKELKGSTEVGLKELAKVEVSKEVLEGSMEVELEKLTEVTEK
jgi:hypothetical protein